MAVKLGSFRLCKSRLISLGARGYKRPGAESEFIDRIHQAKDTLGSTLINPAALSQTCVVKREPFRHHISLSTSPLVPSADQALAVIHTRYRRR